MRFLAAAIVFPCLLVACGETPAPAVPEPAAPVAVAASEPAAPEAPEPAASPAGDYAMTGERIGTLELRETGDGLWAVRLQGGGAPADGAGVAADCEVQARGPLQDGRIAAEVVPFETALMSVTAADLERQPARVTVTLDGEAADVATDFALCALHADLDGRYTREAH